MRNASGERWCSWCGETIPKDAHPSRETCSPNCNYRLNYRRRHPVRRKRSAKQGPKETVDYCTRLLTNVIERSKQRQRDLMSEPEFIAELMQPDIPAYAETVRRKTNQPLWLHQWRGLSRMM